nr:hypothetical protein [Tanacetum cinerariifolium]
MQTQTSNTLHNAIMEAGSKDRPPMLAPDWKDIEVPVSEGSPITTTARIHETSKNVSQEIRDQLNAEAKAQEEAGVQLNAEQANKRDDTDDESDDQELEAHYNKNRNKFLETSNKTLVDKLKGKIEDFKTKNKSLDSSNNHFKEANNELSKTNQLMFNDLKKFQAKLDKYHDVNYVSKVEIDCAKAKGD